ncbi:MAG TPA: hypothetical protein VFP72_09855 [Kineosporiaceae bacterium]|nr:hypothetical protein [Kineosporiaceae bacterium]
MALIDDCPPVGAGPVPRRLAHLTKVVSLVTMMAPGTMTGFFLHGATHVFSPAT